MRIGETKSAGKASEGMEELTGRRKQWAVEWTSRCGVCARVPKKNIAACTAEGRIALFATRIQVTRTATVKDVSCEREVRLSHKILLGVLAVGVVANLV